MEELLKAMGCKPTKDMNLDEVRIQKEDYQNFLGSFDEISEVLEINTELYIYLERIYDKNKMYIDFDYQHRYLYNPKYYREHPSVLANVLLATVMRAHAKIGEISYMLENDVENLYKRETEILDDMEQSANRQD